MKRSHVLGIVFVGSLIAIGIINSLVSRAGYETVGTVIWVIGYGTIIIGAWAVWLRPIDFASPGTSSEDSANLSEQSSEPDQALEDH